MMSKIEKMKQLNFLLLITIFTNFFICNFAIAGENKLRHDAMTTLAKNMKTINQAILNQQPISKKDLEKVREAEKIASEFDILFAKNDSDHPKSRANPIIWTEFEEFLSYANDFKASISVLSSALNSNYGSTIPNIKQIKDAISLVGSNCARCHNQYRLPKK